VSMLMLKGASMLGISEPIRAVKNAAEGKSIV
jgi:hypothetical protein